MRQFNLSSIIALTLLSGALVLWACSSGSTTSATKLVFHSKLIEGGEMAVPRDAAGGTLVGISGLDKAGHLANINPAEIKCTSSDETVVKAIPLGNACIVTGLVDRFDSPPGDAGVSDAGTNGSATDIYGAEPEAVITASIGKTKTELTVRVVVNAAGTWQIEASGLTDEVVFEQVGRKLFVAGTNAPSGAIEDDLVTLLRDGLTFDGILGSRTTVSGTSGAIAWSAKKNP